jgi:hypothetical protein
LSLYELSPLTPTPATSGYQPGAIGLSLGENWREIASLASFDGCWRPSGSRTILAQSLSVPFNTNRIIRATLEDPFMEWLWIQSDDQVWDGMALKGMLDRQVDVLVPLILRRGPPFVPVIYKELGPNGFIPYGYDELPTEGIIEVRMAGSGGMLVRRKVLEAIADPWFEYREEMGPDFVFAEKIREAGFTIYADMEARMGHIGHFQVWPHVVDGEWRIGFDMGTSKDGRRSSFYFDPHEAQRKEEVVKA